MELTRISVPMTVKEREALRALANTELRDIREQARYLIQRELITRGILPSNANSDTHPRQGHGITVAS